MTDAPSGGLEGPGLRGPRGRSESRLLRRVLAPLASLRLTVALLGYSMFLVFAGTWAQVELGIETVVDTVFRAWVAHLGPLPVPGGYPLGALLLVNLLAAHAVRFQPGWRRAGVVLAHAGLVLLLVGELVTALYQKDATLEVSEGQTVSFTERHRELELALIDPTPRDSEIVAAISQRRLAAAAGGEPIRAPGLPCAVRVEAYQANSEVFRGEPLAGGRGPRATAGLGVGLVAIERPQVAGVDASRARDLPSALVTLVHEGQELGTWLVSLWFGGQRQRVTIDGRPFDLVLRQRRDYKPYSIRLIDFTHDRYTGTSVPRNFASRVRLVDPSRGVDREVVISMNNPLRYEGETLYQSAFKDDDRTTILQVVRNPGWTIPYVACALTALGLALHFGLSLSAFLRRQPRAPAGPTGDAAGAPAPASAPAPQRPLARALPWGVVLVAALANVAAVTRGPSDAGALAAFAALPVSYEGRVKPWDTVLRDALRALRNSAHAPGDGGARLSPAAWFAELASRPDAAARRAVFRVDHPQVLGLLGREATLANRYLAYEDLRARRGVILDEARRADQVAPRDRDPYQARVLELWRKLSLYEELASLATLHVLPPASAEEDWRPLSLRDPESQGYLALLRALGGADDAERGRRLADVRDQLARRAPDDVRDAGLEVLFNRWDPFTWCAAQYVLAFVLAALSWVAWRGPLSRAAMGLVLLTLVLHTLALMLRVHLMGRPPVTNLYSSAVFIGWGCVVSATLLEHVFQNGMGVVTAALTGFLSLLIAPGLADGDTMAVLQAVLDTNFWLATHVVVITLGYAATFLASFLALGYAFRGLLTRSLDAPAARSLTQMVYGVTCFATLFSFVGTVLGGIWADQSWGRFWGWDPKENGALLIVLWNALILHARWGGLVRQRGVIAMAIAGSVVTSWSWFGTNMLGVGLHSYGFMEQVLFWLLAADVLVLLAAGAVAFVPPARWRSSLAGPGEGTAPPIAE